MIDFYLIGKLDEWLDENISEMYKSQPLAMDWARVAKVSEEAGEAVAELILWTGQNPRKGTDGEAYERMLSELVDVVVTALCAIQHFTKDTIETRRHIRERMVKLEERLDWKTE